jgi:hypothetical protein
MNKKMPYDSYVNSLNTGMKDAIILSWDFGQGTYVTCGDVRRAIVRSIGLDGFTEVDVPPQGTVRNIIKRYMVGGGFVEKVRCERGNSNTDFSLTDTGAELALPCSNNAFFSESRGLSPFRAYGNAGNNPNQLSFPTVIRPTILELVRENPGIEPWKLVEELEKKYRFMETDDRTMRGKKRSGYIQYFMKGSEEFPQLISGYEGWMNGALRLTEKGRMITDEVVTPNRLFWEGSEDARRDMKRRHAEMAGQGMGPYLIAAMKTYLPFSPKGELRNDRPAKRAILRTLVSKNVIDIDDTVPHIPGNDRNIATNQLNDLHSAGLVSKQLRHGRFTAVGDNTFTYSLYRSARDRVSEVLEQL